MRFVVFKGTAGFGDRLQCLLQAVRYAKASDRYLVVDWRDQEWCHDGLLSFDDFFEIRGIKTFPLEGFLRLFPHLPNPKSIFPKVWERQMFSTDMKTLLYKDIGRTGEKHGHNFDEVAQFLRDDYDEDVVVYSGTGFRAFAYKDFSSLIAKEWLSQNLRQMAKSLQLTHGQYDIVHLRAGSKPWAGGKVALKAYAEKVDKVFPTKESYFDKIDEGFSKARESRDNLPVYVLSDSKQIAEEWILRKGQGQFLGHSFDQKIVGSGIHEAALSELKNSGINKFQVNLDTIRDFAIMLNARHVIYDDMSLFSKMALSCKHHIDASWRF